MRFPHLVSGSILLALICQYSVQGAAPTVGKKYGIKSATLTMDMAMSGPMSTTATQTLYFGNYGAQECIVATVAIQVMGMTINTTSRTIIRDGFVYTLDMDKKTGTKAKMCAVDNPSKLDWTAMTEEAKKKWNMKKEGTETVAGKSCDIYSFATDDIGAASGCPQAKGSPVVGMSGKCWVWNGVGLKSDFMIGPMATTTATTKIDETSPITSGFFEVPVGFKITEQK